MTACEKCWDDARERERLDPTKCLSDHYNDLLRERKDNPCTPAEQAGPGRFARFMDRLPELAASPAGDEEGT